MSETQEEVSVPVRIGVYSPEGYKPTIKGVKNEPATNGHQPNKSQLQPSNPPKRK